MKVCIVGAGAIGGLIGTRLAVAGRARVSALARGATLGALREHGWRMESARGLEQARAHAEDSAQALGPQDLVVIAVKAPALPALAPSLAPLLAPHTVLLPAMNGVPWWFGHGLPGLEERRLEAADPDGGVGRALPVSQVLGCVVHAAATTPQPGLVHHRVGQALIVGEPQGGRSERAREVVDLLAHAGFEATLSEHVRQDLWYKLWGNLTMNPVSALTGATADRILADPLVREFCSGAMREAAAIGARIGCPIDQDPQQRHAVTSKLGAFRTSMLQDVDAGRPLELDAIVTAVREIGQHVAVPTPCIDALLGLTRLFARTRGLYPEA